MYCSIKALGFVFQVLTQTVFFPELYAPKNKGLHDELLNSPFTVIVSLSATIINSSVIPQVCITKCWQKSTKHYLLRLVSVLVSIFSLGTS